jgi:hypothetical protein
MGKLLENKKTTTTKFHDRIKGFFWLEKPFFI